MSGTDLDITNGNSSVVVRPLYPRMPAKSDFIHDYPDDLYWEIIDAPSENLKETESYYSFHLPGRTDRVKGLTAIILKDNPDDKGLPEMERREGKDWIGLRVRNNGKITDLYINQLADGRLMHSNSWIEADCWETDAYMFVVTYDENAEPSQSKDIFICYGSALRRGEDSWFSSLSKLFVIRKDNNGKTELHIDGQPKVRAFFKSATKPSAVELNGTDVPIMYDGTSIKIKY